MQMMPCVERETSSLVWPSVPAASERKVFRLLFCLLISSQLLEEEPGDRKRNMSLLYVEDVGMYFVLFCSKKK